MSLFCSHSTKTVFLTTRPLLNSVCLLPKLRAIHYGFILPQADVNTTNDPNEKSVGVHLYNLISALLFDLRKV